MEFRCGPRWIGPRGWEGHREAVFWEKNSKPKTPEDQANKATEETVDEEVALASLDKDDYVCVAMSEGEPEDEGYQRYCPSFWNALFSN